MIGPPGRPLCVRESALDHTATADGYPYFDVVVYKPPRYGYDNGLRGLHLGTEVAAPARRLRIRSP